MEKWFQRIVGCLALSLAFAPCTSSFGFALLGPYANWMDTTNGYRLPGDIGGPMELGEGYRWNLPVVSYGFDQSFVDYFGTNGIAAVESAIQILNDLPSASAVVPGNYPSASARYNYAAEAQHLLDLKSVTLTLLLEQMGLAPPARNIFTLRRYDSQLGYDGEGAWPAGTIGNLVLERNFDPETLAASHSVNGNLFSGYVDQPLWWLYRTNAWDVIEFLMDPEQVFWSSVCDWRSSEWERPFDSPSPSMAGVYFNGVSTDDIGGLRHLLRSNNIAFEKLPSGVIGAGTNGTGYIDLAYRPGIEKIRFIRHPYDSVSHQFATITNYFTDTYITNSVRMQQQLKRVMIQPDFLFRVAELGNTNVQENGYTRTGTSNWWNSAKLPGSTNFAGPGVIEGPIVITFHRRGAWLETGDSDVPVLYDSREYRWATFDGSANPPIVYPETTAFSGANTLKVRLLLTKDGARGQRIIWETPVPLGGQALLQSSTNLTDWVTLQPITNYGGPIDWTHFFSRSTRFFRVSQQ